MTQVSPDELLSQLVNSIQILADDPHVQEALLKRGKFPVEELILQLIDKRYSFLPRLRELGLLDAQDEARLNELIDYVMNFESKCPGQMTFSALMNSIEWMEIRRLATAVIHSIESGD